MERRACGFTLIETMVVVSTCLIVLLVSVPSMKSMLDRSRTTADLNRITGAINTARHAAVTFSTTATLCHLKESAHPAGCSGSWGEPLTIFLDHNNNAALDENDTVVARVRSLGSGNIVKWRAFQNRPYLQFKPMGYTNFQNGNVVVCPADGDNRQARQLVVNVQGRVRVNHRVDEAGYPIDRRGRLLRC